MSTKVTIEAVSGENGCCTIDISHNRGAKTLRLYIETKDDSEKAKPKFWDGMMGIFEAVQLHQALGAMLRTRQFDIEDHEL